MLHLDPERLAALADDEPSAAEAAHLAECAVCGRERNAHRSLRLMASQERSTVLREPLSEWGALAERLRAEGLIASTAAPAFGAGTRRRAWLSAAAAVLLLLGGGVIGRFSANIGSSSAVMRGGSQQAVAARGVNGAAGPALASAAPLSADTLLTFHSPEEAMQTLRVAERTYRSAADYLASQDTAADSASSPQRFRTRLAALDRMTDAALAAVYEAPHDPVINQYYLSTMTARQATLRQLDQALPAGARLTSY
ncbi:MAG TPA: hypothetical protein VFW98_12975 [Gemmatimonadaceae bacterium]|nr:hypothetical protein [Gemmatimonadaceae bacterium]